MDADLYCQILDEYLVPFIQTVYPHHLWTRNTSRRAQAFFTDRGGVSTGGVHHLNHLIHRWQCNSLTQEPIKMKLSTHILFNEYTTIITVNVVVNNVVLVK